MDSETAPSRSITTLPALLSSLAALQSREAALSSSLTELLSTREPILASLARVYALTPYIDELHQEASLLSHKVSSTAGTANRVGGKVRVLDEEMRRVREAAERVSQVMELKVQKHSHFLLNDSHECPNEVFFDISPCRNGIPRLGVCNQTLCTRHVSAHRCYLGDLCRKRHCRSAFNQLHNSVCFDLVSSPPRNHHYRLSKPSRTHVKSF